MDQSIFQGCFQNNRATGYCSLMNTNTDKFEGNNNKVDIIKVIMKIIYQMVMEYLNIMIVLFLKDIGMDHFNKR